MTQGPLSQDGRHQWNGTEWVPIPKPPVDVWQVFVIGLAVVVVIVAVLGVIAVMVDV